MPELAIMMSIMGIFGKFSAVESLKIRVKDLIRSNMKKKRANLRKLEKLAPVFLFVTRL